MVAHQLFELLLGQKGLEKFFDQPLLVVREALDFLELEQWLPIPKCGFRRFCRMLLY